MHVQVIPLYTHEDKAAREYMSDPVLRKALDDLTHAAITVVLPGQVSKGDPQAIVAALESGKFGKLSILDLPALYVESTEGSFAVCLRDDHETLKTAYRTLFQLAKQHVPFKDWPQKIDKALQDVTHHKPNIVNINVINSGVFNMTTNPTTSASSTSNTTNTTNNTTNMNFGQAGNVGNQGNVQNLNFNNAATQLASQFDLKALSIQLGQLKEEMVKEAKDAEHYEAIAAVAKAEKESKEGQGSSAFAAMKTAGKWALDIATKIGVAIAAKAIEGAIGLPGA